MVRPKDDPSRRKPDISRAKKELGWEPKVTVDEGLAIAIAYFRQELARGNSMDKKAGDSHRRAGPYNADPGLYKKHSQE